MTRQKQEYYLKGFPLSEGIAIGKLHVLAQYNNALVPETPIDCADVDKEIERYRNALSSSRKDLEHLQEVLSDEGSHEAVTIIDTHIQMLEDPLITTFVEQRIKQMLQNTESVFCSVMGEYERRFEAVDDSFQQRLTDVRDVSQRILRHLHPLADEPAMPDNAVIFSKELVPSHTAEASVAKVCAFISEMGGHTSHAALIARAKGIPYVANIDVKSVMEVEGDIVIVDGCLGYVILNPSEETLANYRKIKGDIVEQYQKLVEEAACASVTQDGHGVQIWANVETLADLRHPQLASAQGVGLLRSEFLFSTKDVLSLSEEEQYSLYFEMISSNPDKPIVFRVFDLGGDKGLSHPAALHEINPALGCRGVRFLLHDKPFFKRQLRAILRAGVVGKLSLLFPLIADIDELREVKRVLHEVQEELRREHVSFASHLRLGCMIEMPSAALSCEALAKECDFLSIGTNDLVQYTLAIDRSHPYLHARYKPGHPTILRMIRSIVVVSRLYGKPVSICGEMASNPLFIRLLVGLGVTQFSCAPRHIPLIKKMVRRMSYAHAQHLANTALAMESAKEIEELLKLESI